MVERLRDMRNDRRAEDLIVTADVFAQGALLTKQGSLDGSTTSDGKMAFTQSAFHVLDRWRLAVSIKEQLKFVDIGALSLSGEASPDVKREKNIVGVVQRDLQDLQRRLLAVRASMGS